MKNKPASLIREGETSAPQATRISVTTTQGWRGKPAFPSVTVQYQEEEWSRSRWLHARLVCAQQFRRGVGITATSGLLYNLDSFQKFAGYKYVYGRKWVVGRSGTLARGGYSDLVGGRAIDVIV